MAKTIEMRRATKNRSLFNQAKEYLVGGVNSPVRSFNYIGREPVLIKQGKGSRVFDYDGNSYIDYVLSFGALFLGHAHPRVVKNVSRRAKKGFGFGATSLEEIELARLISEAIPVLEKIRFVNSGTESVMGAIRLARGYTGRQKIVKFKNAYHGHADYLLAKSGSGLATLNISSSKGVPDDFTKHTIVLDYADKALIDHTFEKHAQDIAAVVIEPIGGNYGVIVPDNSFLQYLREVTQKHKALLIFDEVITGFRFRFGSVAEIFGVQPDLICLGKIIGGGLPIGAFGGKRDIMYKLAPLGEVYQASTFAGNPIVMKAGFATLSILASLKDKYSLLEQLANELVESLKQRAKRYNIDLTIASYGTMFSLKFKEKDKFRLFYKKILEEGVYLAPSEFEANFLSFAHTKRDIEKTKQAARRAFESIKKYGDGSQPHSARRKVENRPLLRVR
ncbi:MAG: glutamate-1-semialdehyde 2,1-aminomutase [Candidatus Omnitrophota bacterium]